MADERNRWRRIQELFEKASELTPGGREQFVSSLSDSDAELRSELTSLLEADTRAERFIEGAIEEGSRLVAEEAPAIPTSFGKYEVLEAVGRGGFGVVYRGRDPALRRTVAIKVCSTGDDRLRQRFFREGHIAAGLQHPNITTVHDLGVQDGAPFLVQEFLDGEDLSRVIERNDPLPLERRLDILRQIAAALEYAHGRGILHRDVKPANVRVLPDGSVKLMDFGIAKALQEETRLTTEGQAMGTVGYLPPEQLRGEPVDPRSDVFAFGVLAYELLGGRRPFDGQTFSEISYKLLYEEPAPLSETWPECPPGLEAIVHRCLRKSPDDRYAGLGELLEDLESGLDRGHPPPSAGRRSRWRVPAAVGAVALVGAALGMWLSGRAVDDAAPSPRQEPVAAVGAAAPRLPPRPDAEPDASVEEEPATPAPSRAPLPVDAGSLGAAGRSEQPLQSPAPQPEKTAAVIESKPEPVETQVVATESPTVPEEPPAVAESRRPPAQPAVSASEAAQAIALPSPGGEVGEIAQRARPQGSAVAGRREDGGREAAMRVGDLIPPNEGAKPVLLSELGHIYPPRAKRRRLEAQVLVAVLVDERGEVIQTLLKRGAEPDVGFDEAALEAAKKARFRPATKDGVPGKMWTELTFDFKLPR